MREQLFSKWHDHYIFRTPDYKNWITTSMRNAFEFGLSVGQGLGEAGLDVSDIEPDDIESVVNDYWREEESNHVQ